MTLTIRSRLTIWFTLAFSAVLLLVVGALALQLYNQFESDIGETLRNEESWITALVANEFQQIGTAQGSDYDSLAADLDENLEERYGLKQQFAFLIMTRPSGSQAHFEGGLQGVGELLPVNFLRRSEGVYDLQIAGDHYRVRLFQRDWGTAVVGMSNERIYEIAEEAGKILVWFAPLAMLIAIAGGWLLAKLALRPVVAAARGAESISLANLSGRLPAYSGKDEFGALVSTLNRMIARLEEGVKRLQQFTQDAAHELRTPLTVLRGELELAYQDENTPEETRAGLQKILDRVIALGQIVDNLMLLARSDSGEYPIHKTRFRLDLAVKEIFEDLQILAEGRPLAVHLLNHEIVEFFGDELLLRRLLLNLCDNALKYTRQGSVTLSMKKVDGQVELDLTDTGHGIPAEDLPHIFDRFYRVDKSHSSATGGSGLGLAICRWIVSAHGGNITVNSNLGQGTTVRVSLPAQPA